MEPQQIVGSTMTGEATNHSRSSAELHNLPSHAHTAATTDHGKGDHLTAHELSTRAHEHSANPQEHAEASRAEEEKPGKS
jgi:hypothetical protein